MNSFQQIKQDIQAKPRRWLVTGVAGFIGSNLLETLLELDQEVAGLDDFSTGSPSNLEEVRRKVGAAKFARFRLIEGDVCDPAKSAAALKGAELVLHQAANGSVLHSIEDPLASNASNVTGHLTLLHQASRGGVQRFVYASSSAVYGDDEATSKTEAQIGRQLSPYGVTKYVNELYADTLGRLTGLGTVGLRYFNVFGPRQDPNGAYAAVIPTWIFAMMRGDDVRVFGTGETTRDFCHVQDVVQANLLAALTERPEAIGQVYNIALGQRTSLNQLFAVLCKSLQGRYPRLATLKPVYHPFRPGDVLYSLADIGLARRLLGYEPTHSLEQGLAETLDWYQQSLAG